MKRRDFVKKTSIVTAGSLAGLMVYSCDPDGKAWPSRTVYGWEAKGKVARPKVQKRLAELGICQPSDWIDNAPPDAAEKSPAKRPNPSNSSHSTKKASRMSDTTIHPFHDLHTHGFVRVATSTPRTRRSDHPETHA